MRHKLLIAIFAASLTGCAGVHQQSALKEQEQIKYRILDRFESDPLIATIRQKMWVGEIDQAPLHYLTNKSFVTDADKPALERWWTLNQENARDIEAYYTKHTPHYLPIWETHRAAFFTNFVLLFEGKLSYGEYHNKLNSLTAKFKDALTERAREFAARQNEARSQAMNDYFNFLLMQRSINNQGQPTVTAPPNIGYDLYAPPPRVNCRIIPNPYGDRVVCQ